MMLARTTIAQSVMLVRTTILLPSAWNAVDRKWVGGVASATGSHAARPRVIAHRANTDVSCRAFRTPDRGASSLAHLFE